jgi:hypothetical protein
VRRSVSGATPTLKKEERSNSVMVRQVPFTLMLSPREASLRIGEQFVIVRDVPEPPEAVESREVRALTASRG